MGSMPISLPPDLVSFSLDCFDKLLASDSIKYAESTPELIVYPSGQEVQFRVISSLSRKPLLPSSSVSHTTPLPPPAKKEPFNPFLNPKKEEIILEHVGPYHRLLMNMYCVTRPMLLLTSVEFQRQSDDLKQHDIEAIWAVLRNVGKGWMAIYNCGPESGNSQLHKHLQCFPKFGGVSLPPEKLVASKKVVGEGIYALEGLPYQNFVAYLPPDIEAEGIYQLYLQLLQKTKSALKDQPDEPSYNVILVHEWMMLVPRSHAGRDGVGTNATGVAGMIWLANEQERVRWEELGVLETLEFVGVGW